MPLTAEVSKRLLVWMVRRISGCSRTCLDHRCIHDLAAILAQDRFLVYTQHAVVARMRDMMPNWSHEMNNHTEGLAEGRATRFRGCKRRRRVIAVLCSTRTLYTSLALFLGSCSTSIGTFPPGSEFCAIFNHSVCRLMRDVTLSPPVSSSRNVVFEDPGTIIAYHGSGCAASDEPRDLKVEESLDIPPYAANATVFLNGWDLQYRSSDNNVNAFATVIGNIRLEEKTLKWNAAGVLRDKDFDNPYKWCYFYTIIAWNPSTVNLSVDHKDGCDTDDPIETNYFVARNEGTSAALSSFSTFLHNRGLGFTPVTIAPRGFSFRVTEDVCDDRNLAHAGYNRDHSEIFVKSGTLYKKAISTVAALPVPPNQPNLSLVDSGFVSWDTSAILNDDSGRFDYLFGEMVSAASGNDVAVIEPPFSIIPEPVISCVSGPGPAVRSEEVEIDNIPYEYAIPMLTGWDLQYDCDDNNVTEMGIWIDEWNYDRSIGKLRYKLSSSLRDEDSKPDFVTRHKVSVLGIKPVSRGETPTMPTRSGNVGTGT
jgi:hypothetical protein